MGFLLLIISVLVTVPVHPAYAAQSGYCWNDKIGWVSLAGVSFNSDTRKLSGTAVFSSNDGEIDFTEQSGQSISVAVSSTLSGGQYAITGQAFSEEVGWVVANHGGTNEAAFTSDGKLAGNFWSNEVGWFNCAESDVGSASVHIIDNVTPVTTSDSSSDTENSASGGGGGGVRKSTLDRMVEGAMPLNKENTLDSSGDVPPAVSLLLHASERLTERAERRIQLYPNAATLLRNMLQRLEARIQNRIERLLEEYE